MVVAVTGRITSPGLFCYADDLTILAPSPDALRKMLALCEQYAQAHGIQFNADKTQLICFRRTAGSDHTRFSLCGHCLPMVDSVVHLGNTLQYDLSDKLDIHLKSMAFIRQANSVLFRFKGCNPETKMKLFNAYCLSLYGCALWRLDAPDIRSLHVSFNNVIRRIWNLPHNCHTSIAHAVGFTKSIYNIIYSRFIRLLSTALSHSSSFIRSVFHESSLVCNSCFIAEVEIRFCGCAVICPSTPDFVRSITFLFSHTLRIRVHAPLILFSHLHFVPSIRIVSRRKHCLLNNFAI